MALPSPAGWLLALPCPSTMSLGPLSGAQLPSLAGGGGTGPATLGIPLVLQEQPPSPLPGLEVGLSPRTQASSQERCPEEGLWF